MGRPVCAIRDRSLRPRTRGDHRRHPQARRPERPGGDSASTFESDLRSGLGALWLMGEFGDVQLQPVVGASVVAYRAVLAPRSAHFKTLLEAKRASFDGAAVGGAIVGVDAERDALVGMPIVRRRAACRRRRARSAPPLREQARAVRASRPPAPCTAALARAPRRVGLRVCARGPRVRRAPASTRPGSRRRRIDLGVYARRRPLRRRLEADGFERCRRRSRCGSSPSGAPTGSTRSPPGSLHAARRSAALLARAVCRRASTAGRR